MKTIVEDDGSVDLYSEYDQGASTSGWPYTVSNTGGPIAGGGLKQGPYSYQVGGSHYAKCRIQPMEYILANGLGFGEGCVVKYVTRWKDKGGVEDLHKSIHVLEMMITEASK